MLRVRCRRKKFTFAISSPDEFLSPCDVMMMKVHGNERSGERKFLVNDRSLQERINCSPSGPFVLGKDLGHEKHHLMYMIAFLLHCQYELRSRHQKEPVVSVNPFLKTALNTCKAFYLRLQSILFYL